MAACPRFTKRRRLAARCLASERRCRSRARCSWSGQDAWFAPGDRPALKEVHLAVSPRLWLYKRTQPAPRGERPRRAARRCGPLSRDNPINCVRSGQPAARTRPAIQPARSAYPRCSPDSVTPALASSSGGTAMVLRGQHLQSGARVPVDGQAASGVEVRSESELSFRLPAGTHGLWRVAVAVENPTRDIAASDRICSPTFRPA